MEAAPGVRIGNETSSYVSSEERVKAVGDRLVIEPLEWEPSKIIRVAYSGRPLRGIVRSVGPGQNAIKYDGPKGKRTKKWWGNRFISTTVQVGDVVELGGLDLGTGALRGYAFQTFLWGTKEHIICREEDVAGIVE